MVCSFDLLMWRQKGYFLTDANDTSGQYIYLLFQKYEQNVKFNIFFKLFFTAIKSAKNNLLC